VTLNVIYLLQAFSRASTDTQSVACSFCNLLYYRIFRFTGAVHVCFCRVRFSFFSANFSDWLWRLAPKWPIFVSSRSL